MYLIWILGGWLGTIRPAWLGTVRPAELWLGTIRPAELIKDFHCVYIVLVGEFRRPKIRSSSTTTKNVLKMYSSILKKRLAMVSSRHLWHFSRHMPTDTWIHFQDAQYFFKMLNYFSRYLDVLKRCLENVLKYLEKASWNSVFKTPLTIFKTHEYTFKTLNIFSRR